MNLQQPEIHHKPEPTSKSTGEANDYLAVLLTMELQSDLHFLERHFGKSTKDGLKRWDHIWQPTEQAIWTSQLRQWSSIEEKESAFRETQELETLGF